MGEKLPGMEQAEMDSLADRLEVLNTEGINFVHAIINQLRKGDLKMARWFAFESGDKWDTETSDIQELLMNDLFFGTVDGHMIPNDF